VAKFSRVVLRPVRLLCLAVTFGVVAVATAPPSPQLDAVSGHTILDSSYAFPETGFGGYLWRGTVTSLQARWRTPSISPTSRPGGAATWIGVQSTTSNGFIQVGVTEFAEASGKDIYSAFWSDAGLKFHPQPLGALSPGESIVASMKRYTSGWHISIRNGSHSWSVTRNIRYSSNDQNSIAEWIQEDPSSGSGLSRDIPYPKISNVKFSNVLLNGSSPLLKIKNGLVLIASADQILVPTKMSDDSFTFVAPKGAQRQYLKDALALDTGSYIFQGEYDRWAHTSQFLRILEVKIWIHTLARVDKSFQNQTWKSNIRPLISKLILVTKRQIADLTAWLNSDLARNSNDYSKYSSLAKSHYIAIAHIRSSLNLPPLQ
jgi:hypothetical protein